MIQFKQKLVTRRKARTVYKCDGFEMLFNNSVSDELVNQDDLDAVSNSRPHINAGETYVRIKYVLDKEIYTLKVQESLFPILLKVKLLTQI
jgi:hypothetical protein